MVLDMLPVWRHEAVLTWPFFPLSPLSSPLSRPAAGGQLVKSAAVCSVIKIIQVLLGLPREGGMGA